MQLEIDQTDNSNAKLPVDFIMNPKFIAGLVARRVGHETLIEAAYSICASVL